MDQMRNPDDQPLIDLLNRLATQARPHFEHAAEFRDDFSGREYSAWRSRQPSTDLQLMQKAVEEALQAHSLFGREQSRFFEDNQLVLSPFFQSFNVLKVSTERGPADAAAWLRKVWTTTCTDIRYVVEVHGVKLTKPERLSNGVTLVPLTELPDSAQARRFIAQNQRHFLPFARPFFPPVGAMLEVLRVQGSESRDPGTSGNGGRSEILEASVRALALVADATPVVGVGWIDFMDPDLALAEWGQKWSTSRHESDLAGRAPSPHPIDESALEWVERYLRLPPEVKRKVDVAVERLALARRRSHPGNKAIEGAICLEALLGGDGSQDLTYRLRLRAALLLTDEVQERAQISRAVRDLYELRSKTVHGTTSLRKDLARDHARAERGVAVCADAARAIVRLGRKYEPEAWELSGGSPVAPERGS